MRIFWERGAIGIYEHNVLQIHTKKEDSTTFELKHTTIFCMESHVSCFDRDIARVCSFLQPKSFRAHANILLKHKTLTLCTMSFGRCLEALA